MIKDLQIMPLEEYVKKLRGGNVFNGIKRKQKKIKKNNNDLND